MSYKRLNEINLSNKSVLLRLDLNTPIENGLVTNNERIIRSLPTLNYIIEAGARLIIMSHWRLPRESLTGSGLGVIPEQRSSPEAWRKSHDWGRRGAVMG